jgi:hypothetical protein
MMLYVMHDGRGLDAVSSSALVALTQRTLVEQPMTEAAPARAGVQRASEVTIGIQAAGLLHALTVGYTAPSRRYGARAGEDGARRGIRRGVGVSHESGTLFRLQHK